MFKYLYWKNDKNTEDDINFSQCMQHLINIYHEIKTFYSDLRPSAPYFVKGRPADLFKSCRNPLKSILMG